MITTDGNTAREIWAYGGTEEVAWSAQPGPQSALLACPVPDILFGGARGGGKTDGLIGDWLSHQHEYRHRARGIIFRRSYPELEEVEKRCLEVFPATGGRYKSQRKTWYWPNGSTLKLRYLQKDKDASKYQGHSYTWMAFDELTMWASPRPIDLLGACLRSAHGVPCVQRNTANPGGPGHNWVKARYIDPSPAMVPFWDADEQTGALTQRVYIPSRLEHNQLLMQNDPKYWQRVATAAGGRRDLLLAWRWGNWNIVAGGMFDDVWLPDVHVLPAFPIPHGWKIDRGFDWGSSAPYACLWFAESDGTEATFRTGHKFCVPRGSLFICGEEYGWDGKTPNKGLRLTNTEIGQRIVEKEEALKFRGRTQAGPADSAIFDIVNGKSIHETLEATGAGFTAASKGPGSRVTGWSHIRNRLKASHQWPMEEPGLFVFEGCRQVIRTLPTLPRDEEDPDDTDEQAEDHIGDVIRYRLSKEAGGVRTMKFSGEANSGRQTTQQRRSQ